MASLFRRVYLSRLSSSVSQPTRHISRPISQQSLATSRPPLSIRHQRAPFQAFHSQTSLSTRPDHKPRELYPRYSPRQQQQQQQQRHEQDQSYYQAHEQNSNQNHNPRPRSSLSSSTLLRISLLACPSAILFYIFNLETVPISGRRRFNCFGPESAERQGEMACREILQRERARGRILDEGDPRMGQVVRVLGRLITSGSLVTNGDEINAEGSGGQLGSKKGWEVYVIDDPDTVNAFVLPGGKVFVYTGILPYCHNDDGLAAVLGHEAAHNICQHVAERMSSYVYLQPLIWTLMYADFLVLGTPFGFGQLIGGWLLDLVVSMPGSRQQESEADHVGLLLMARACFDPKEAPRFWQRMEKAKQLAPPEWLSTHPSNEHRIEAITRLIPKAEEEGLKNGCGVTSAFAGPFKRLAEDRFW